MGPPTPGLRVSDTGSPAPVDARGAVVLTGVTKTFDGVVAVDDVSLAVRPGEFLSLLGPSGCGKTTTLRILAGSEQPDAGTVEISGVDVAGVPPHRRDVNTVFIGQQNFFRGEAADGGAVVRAAGFALRSARPAATHAQGAGVLAAVRPERVEVTEVEPGDDVHDGVINMVRGTLASAAHLGDVIQYLIQADGGWQVVARRPRGAAARIAPGSTVWCRWDPEDVQVFSDDGR